MPSFAFDPNQKRNWRYKYDADKMGTVKHPEMLAAPSTPVSTERVRAVPCDAIGEPLVVGDHVLSLYGGRTGETGRITKFIGGSIQVQFSPRRGDAGRRIKLSRNIVLLIDIGL